MPRRWVNHLGLLTAWFAACLVIGYWLDSVAWVLLAGSAIYLIVTLRKLYMLDELVATGKRPSMTSTHGLWPVIVARVEMQRRKSRLLKKRHLSFLREVRRSTDAIDAAGMLLNSEREIVWFNSGAEDLIGLERGRDIGQRVDNLIRDPDFIEYLGRGSGPAIVVKSPSRENRMISISLVPYGKDQAIAIARDVTREIQLEQARRDFVANASHELRSPLTVIGGYLDALSDDTEIPAGWRPPIAEMLRQTERMTQILRDLIELARLESADERAELEVVDVCEIVTRMQSEFAARDDGPELTIDLDEKAVLLGNETELHSVFYNLINNAYRFTPSDGKVNITWACANGGAVFEVTDNGIGIAQEHIPRLTERFYRVDPGRSRASGGTGLGLAIVKHVLQRHGASLKIESDQGKGSSFKCVFPASRVVPGKMQEKLVL